MRVEWSSYASDKILCHSFAVRYECIKAAEWLRKSSVALDALEVVVRIGWIERTDMKISA